MRKGNERVYQFDVYNGKKVTAGCRLHWRCKVQDSLLTKLVSLSTDWAPRQGACRTSQAMVCGLQTLVCFMQHVRDHSV